jgi:hypothetical protein
VEDQRFLGDAEFSKEISREAGEITRRKRKKPIEETFKTIARQSKVAVEVLRGEDRRWEITKKRVALLIQEHGYRVGEVAKYLRRDQAHVSTMLSRLSAREKERDRESL